MSRLGEKTANPKQVRCLNVFGTNVFCDTWKNPSRTGMGTGQVNSCLR